MRKVIVGAMVSMDGVMQAPGGPEEDPAGGFKFGGWVAPFADIDPVFGEEIGKLFGRAVRPPAWPSHLRHLRRRTGPSPKADPTTKSRRRFNRITKYVATRKAWTCTGKLRRAA